MAAAVRARAPSMPVRKYYSAPVKTLALDRTEQCCGVCLPSFTTRGSATCLPFRLSLDTPGRRPVFRPPLAETAETPIPAGLSFRRPPALVPDSQPNVQLAINGGDDGG